MLRSQGREKLRLISVKELRIDRTWRREEKMVGANLKAETMALMDKRTAMETEMNSIVERLCNPGGPGLSGNLIDSEVLYLRPHSSLILTENSA